MKADASSHKGSTPKGIVYLVGAGPGDPGLLTLKGRSCLENAHVVIHDRLIHPLLLSLPEKAELIDVGKRPDAHPVPQEEILEILVKHGREGKIVVRLKGGDPFVFGRGGEEAAALVEAGIPFEVVPGVTSPVAGPAYAGIPITHRGLARSVAFITGHHVEEEDVTRSWREAAQSADTLVFLMGVTNLAKIVSALIDGGRPAQSPAAVVRRATLADQVTINAPLEKIVEAARGIEPPALLIVGEVAAMGNLLSWLDRSPMKPLRGLKILLLGKGAEAFELGLRCFDAGAEVLTGALGHQEGIDGVLVVTRTSDLALPDWLDEIEDKERIVALNEKAHRVLTVAGIPALVAEQPADFTQLLERLKTWRAP